MNLKNLVFWIFIALFFGACAKYDLAFNASLKECQSKEDKIEGCIEKVINGVHIVKTPYKNGQKHGIVETYYYEGGELDSLLPYKEGKLHGVARYYYGEFLREMTFKEGKVQGFSKVFYPNGALKIKTFFKNSKRQYAKHYYPNGKIAVEVLFEENKPTKKMYFSKDTKLSLELNKNSFHCNNGTSLKGEEFLFFKDQISKDFSQILSLFYNFDEDEKNLDKLINSACLNKEFSLKECQSEEDKKNACVEKKYQGTNLIQESFYKNNTLELEKIYTNEKHIYLPYTFTSLKNLVDDETIKLSDINTSKITSMSELFINSERMDFSGIENWDTSKVVNMEAMFSGAKNFNADLNAWDISSLRIFTTANDISSMFAGTKLTNPPQWYQAIPKDIDEVITYIEKLSIRLNDKNYKVSQKDEKYIKFYIKVTSNRNCNLIDYHFFKKLADRNFLTPYPLNECKKNIEEYRNLVFFNNFTLNKEFARYFSISQECESRELKHCYFKLNEPLKMKTNLSVTSSLDYEFIPLRIFYINQDKGNINLLGDELEKFKKDLPQWFKDGLAGELVYEVEFEVENKKQELAYIDDSKKEFEVALTEEGLYIKNLKIIQKLREEIYPRDWYERGASADPALYFFKIDSEDGFANLRQSPNGKILAQLKNDEEGKIFNLERLRNMNLGELGFDENDDYDSELNAFMLCNNKKCKPKAAWIRVLYFPPQAKDIKNALMGYIHSSQLIYDKERY